MRALAGRLERLEVGAFGCLLESCWARSTDKHERRGSAAGRGVPLRAPSGPFAHCRAAQRRSRQPGRKPVGTLQWSHSFMAADLSSNRSPCRLVALCLQKAGEWGDKGLPFGGCDSDASLQMTGG